MALINYCANVKNSSFQFHSDSHVSSDPHMHIPDDINAIIQLDAFGQCLYVNNDWTILTGLDHYHSIGKGWHSCFLSLSNHQIQHFLDLCHSNDIHTVNSISLRHINGSRTETEICITKIKTLFDDCQGFIVKIQPIKPSDPYSELNDEITGLAGRILFMRQMDHIFESAKRTHKRYALISIDIDDFRLLNDHLGHEVGDLILKKVAEKIKCCVRREDIVARLGADEFAVIIESMKCSEDAALIARKIINSMKTPLLNIDHDIFATVSIGIATSGNGNSNTTTMLKQSDFALAKAKELGKNDFYFYHPDLNKTAKFKIKLKTELHNAIHQNELSLVYQDQKQLSDNQTVGIEALLRWNHPVLGKVPPRIFIPILEESDIFRDISNWIIEHACSDFHARQLSNPTDDKCKLSINMSARQFSRPDFIETITRSLEKTAIYPEQVVLEITEHTLIRDMQASQKTIWLLKERGIQIALDDFGVGYSSLSLLKELPIDYLKIDKSFVDDINSAPNTLPIINAILELGHCLGIKVVAEGIDSEEKNTILRELGCDIGQGFYLGKPVAISANKQELS